MLGFIIGIVLAVVMWNSAKKKGFSPWLWFLGGSLLWLIILQFMPSAAESGIEETEAAKRHKTANMTGGVLTAVSIVLGVISVIVQINNLS
jgi:hypothetical protein